LGRFFRNFLKFSEILMKYQEFLSIKILRILMNFLNFEEILEYLEKFKEF
jgi:hypothetical protein